MSMVILDIVSSAGYRLCAAGGSRLRDDPPARYHDVPGPRNALPIHQRTTSLLEAEDFYRRICER